MAARNRLGSALRLDVENGWVWRGPQRLEPTLKAFGVLRYLVEHPGRVVSKEELLRAIGRRRGCCWWAAIGRWS